MGDGIRKQGRCYDRFPVLGQPVPTPFTRDEGKRDKDGNLKRGIRGYHRGKYAKKDTVQPDTGDSTPSG